MLEMLGMPRMFEIIGMPIMLEMLGMPRMLEMLGIPRMLKMLGMPRVLEMLGMFDNAPKPLRGESKFYAKRQSDALGRGGHLINAMNCNTLSDS